MNISDEVKRIDDLDIAQSLKAQQRLWLVQRWGRGFALLIILLALFGLFGNGMLSSQKASQGNWSIQYQRLGYFEAEQTYQISIKKSLVEDNQIKIWIENEALKQISVTKITPEPIRTVLSARKSIFIFSVKEEEELSDIYFSFKPKTFGRVSYELGVLNGSSLALKHFYWP